jgi:hypothetical protein
MIRADAFPTKLFVHLFRENMCFRKLYAHQFLTFLADFLLSLLVFAHQEGTRKNSFAGDGQADLSRPRKGEDMQYAHFLQVRHEACP